MSETEKIKEAVSEDEGWAVLPFDEAEDDERWAKLSNELDELAEDVARHEAVFGKILMEGSLTKYFSPKNSAQNQDERLFSDDPF